MVIERDISSRNAVETSRYVRRARRVRARLGHDPVRMHEKLRELHGGDDVASECRVQVRRVNRRLAVEFPFQAHPGLAEAFVGEVENTIEDGVLRYSRRAALLRLAQTLGIGRFEANLLIASVLHRYGNGVTTPDAAEGANGWGGVIVVMLMIQAIIVGAVWCVVAA